MLTEEIKIGNMKCISVSPIGEYKKFIDENVYTFEGKFLNTNKTFVEYYSELLNNGKCLFYKRKLIFKKGYEKRYLNYAKIYINNQNDKIFEYLNDKSNYGIVKCFVEMYKNGFLKKENFIQKISKYVNLDISTIEELIAV